MAASQRRATGIESVNASEQIKALSDKVECLERALTNHRADTALIAAAVQRVEALLEHSDRRPIL
jgi:hypothetical protein